MAKSAEVKLAIFGRAGVGKSALVVRFLTKRFIWEYDPTLVICLHQLCIVQASFSKNNETVLSDLVQYFSKRMAAAKQQALSSDFRSNGYMTHSQNQPTDTKQPSMMKLFPWRY
ncbi:ras-related and estrogen-regulated growth inhibitor isoform X2 [Homo sapiens]|uniref:ras-related and estrogen-regulated growth inhibitor isoform X2 n=1 Tax=Homo sapiens TaxID=9606 RepID=UPI0023DF6A2F|nr:ras-related and estrogen-regulated growth inhibitor isoform X2 [Homo sapiens]